jgi:hypothetical protein
LTSQDNSQPTNVIWNGKETKKCSAAEESRRVLRRQQEYRWLRQCALFKTLCFATIMRSAAALRLKSKAYTVQPGKSLYTTIRELVENSLDSAEGIGQLPSVKISMYARKNG